MIKELTPLTLAEVSELMSKEEKQEKLRAFIKQFTKMPAKEARQMKEELKKLDLIKLKDKHIVKIVDFMPKDAADLTKIVSDVSFNQEEISKILDVVSKY